MFRSESELASCHVCLHAMHAMYVCTHEEFVLVKVAPQCNRITAKGQDTDNNKNIKIIIK